MPSTWSPAAMRGSIHLLMPLAVFPGCGRCPGCSSADKACVLLEEAWHGRTATRCQHGSGFLLWSPLVKMPGVTAQKCAPFFSVVSLTQSHSALMPSWENDGEI